MEEDLNTQKTSSKVGVWVKTTFSIHNLISFFLAFVVISSGSMLILALKIQDECVAKAGPLPPFLFEKPFFQTLVMFFGEITCLLFSAQFFQRCLTANANSTSLKDLIKDGEENREKETLIKHSHTKSYSFDMHTDAIADDLIDLEMNNTLEQVVSTLEGEWDGNIISKDPPEPKETNGLVFIIPAFCDTFGTTLMNIGLLFVWASVYQMMRGISTVFNCVLSVLILKSKRYFHHWVGITFIVLGLVVVGLDSFFFWQDRSGAKNPLLGIILILVAQVFTAIQFISEEKIINHQPNINLLKVVGWEGFFGVCMTLSILFVLFYIPGRDFGSIENLPMTAVQLTNNWVVFALSFVIATSLLCFNVFGIMITKRVSSTARATINTIRIVVIWVVQMIRGKEKFQWLELGGFLIMISGTIVYNEVVKIPFYNRWHNKRMKKDAEMSKDPPE